VWAAGAARIDDDHWMRIGAGGKPVAKFLRMVE
jgi:hypothetical protein